MTILQTAADITARDTAEARDQYVKILERSLSRKSISADGAMLPELLATMHKGTADAERDIANLRALRQREKNLADMGTIESIRAEVDSSHAEAKAKFAEMEAAQKAFSMAQAKLNFASDKITLLQNATYALEEARKNFDAGINGPQQAPAAVRGLIQRIG